MANILNNSDYYKYLQDNLGVLINNGKIGVSKFEPADVVTKNPRYLEVIGGYKNYHFSINVPYAGKILNWEVIFDPEDYSELPDFDFNDYSFMPEPDINYIAENVTNWDNWDLTDPNSVLNILNEFLVLYKKAQIEKLKKQNKFDNLRQQYEELLKAMNLTPEDVEVQIELKSDTENDTSTLALFDDFTMARLLIVLPIDFAQLPDYYQEENGELLNPSEDFAHLFVQMKKLDNSQTKVALHVCSRMEAIVGKLKLPKFSKDSTLADYAKFVKRTLEQQIKSIRDQHLARTAFVSALVANYSDSIVEYDTTRFQKVCFIYEDSDDYSCLVTVQLGPKFPEERPKIQLQSLYCQAGRTCSIPVIFLYDPQDSNQKNLNSLKELLRQEVKSFQNHAH